MPQEPRETHLLVDPRRQCQEERYVPFNFQSSFLHQAKSTSTSGYNVNFQYEANDDIPMDPYLVIESGFLPLSGHENAAFGIISRYKSQVLDELEWGRTREEACKIIRALTRAVYPVYRRRASED